MLDLANGNFVERIFAEHQQAQRLTFEITLPPFKGVIKLPDLTGYSKDIDLKN